MSPLYFLVQLYNANIFVNGNLDTTSKLFRFSLPRTFSLSPYAFAVSIELYHSTWQN